MRHDQKLDPILNSGEYVFCHPLEGKIEAVEIIGFFKESEGITFIIGKDIADRLGLRYDDVWAWITLNSHTSLTEVGITARFSTALASEGISCNVIAAIHHDHIFVRTTDAHKAIGILSRLKM